MTTRASLLLVAAVFLISGCVTHLRVQTEVYKGPTPPDPLPQTVAKLGSIAETALNDYGTRAVETSAANYEQVLRIMLRRYPEMERFGVTESSLPDFKQSMADAARKALEPAMRSAASATALARELKSTACPTTTGCGSTVPTDELFQQWVKALRTKVADTARLGRSAIQQLNNEEMAQYRRLLRLNFENPRSDAFPNDPTLAKFTGRDKIKNGDDRRAAINEVLANVDTITAELRASDDPVLESLLVSEPLNVQRLLVRTAIVPLDDPAIAMILDETEKNPGVWKKYVNDVESANIWGNAEIAFRMDGLGDSHIKGVLFDSSQAMKTGFSVLAKTVEATATAFGGAAFTASAVKNTGTTAVESGDTGTAATATQLSTKPAIDAEVSRLVSATSMRREVMESLFWQLTALGKSLPADGDAPDPAKKLIALLECAQNEIADPTGRRCGGE